MSAERSPERRRVGDIALDQLTVADSAAMAGGEIVVDNHAIAGAVESLARMGADIAGAPRDEDAAPVSGQWIST